MSAKKMRPRKRTGDVRGRMSQLEYGVRRGDARRWPIWPPKAAHCGRNDGRKGRELGHFMTARARVVNEFLPVFEDVGSSFGP